MNALGLEPDEGTQNTKYYVLINLLDLVRKQYGDEFAAWFEENYKEMEFLDDLARKKGVVVMYGPGFDADENTVRISLANGNTEDYGELARRLFELLGECCAAFEKETLETAA